MLHRVLWKACLTHLIGPRTLSRRSIFLRGNSNKATCGRAKNCVSAATVNSDCLHKVNDTLPELPVLDWAALRLLLPTLVQTSLQETTDREVQDEGLCALTAAHVPRAAQDR